GPGRGRGGAAAVSTDRRTGTVLTVAGDLDTVTRAVAEFFTAHGWTVHERGPGRLEVGTGSLRRTLLLGAFAGSRFRLSALLELRELSDAVEVRHRWGAGAGRALGGASGRARAARRHLETSAALERHLAADGRPVRSRPLSRWPCLLPPAPSPTWTRLRSIDHTSELRSHFDLV